MPPEECPPPSRWRRGKQILSSVLRFSLSAVAEYLVYVLLFYSTTSLVTFFVFLPLDYLLGLWQGEASRGYLVDFHYYAFCVPFNFRLSTFALPARILLITVWATTARPALAVAGCIIQKRLPAYTYPSEEYPPIRWLFEIICSFANRYHKLVPDIELYTRRILRMLGARIAPASYDLGTISPRDHDELRAFARMYQEVDAQFSERSSQEPNVYWLPSKIADEAHYACALVVLQQAPLTSKGFCENCTPSFSGAAQPLSLKRRITFWKWLDWEHVRSEAKSFSYVYMAIVFYWAFRPFHDVGAFLLPYALGGKAVSSTEEWYDRHILAPAAMNCKEHGQPCDSEDEAEDFEQLEDTNFKYLEE